MRRTITVTATLAALFILGATRVYAEGFVTPFVGATFGDDAPTAKLTEGLSLLSMGHTSGAELEFGYTPDFFNQQSITAIISNSNVTTLMGNLVIGPDRGWVRPYVVAGIGLLRSRVSAGDLFTNVDTNDWGLDVGAGGLFRVGRGVFIRGDLRYFRTFEKAPNVEIGLGRFDFFRGTVGVAFRM